MVEKRVEELEQQLEVVINVLEKVLERIDQLDELVIKIVDKLAADVGLQSHGGIIDVE